MATMPPSRPAKRTALVGFGEVLGAVNAYSVAGVGSAAT
jgi:hypothetical protein